MGSNSSFAAIDVGATGRVAGNRAGIWLDGAGTITNLGLITGNADAGIVQFGAGGLTIINEGTIVSEAQAAIQIVGDGTHVINNSGTLKGALGGIRSFNSGIEIVTNTGTIIGNIELGGGGDQVFNTGTITGTVFLGSGGDLYEGSSGVDIVNGGADADTLRGFGGDDQLTGGDGGDFLTGGTGNDTMTGGLVNDDYFVDSQGDVIVEVAGGGLFDQVLASVSFALAGDDDIEGMKALGPASTAAINLTGNAHFQEIIGNAGNNILDGGVDLLVDELIGLGGNDTYVLGTSTNDTVTDSAGIDTITSSITRSLLSYTNIENLTLTGSDAANATGTAGANVLIGNAGINRIEGGAGKDTETGGLGNDRFVFKTAADSLVGGNRDTITDFTVAGTLERIDLSGFAGSFAFRGTGPFTSAAKEVSYKFSGAKTLVRIDLDGDTAAEMEIMLVGHKVLTATDFFL